MATSNPRAVVMISVMQSSRASVSRMAGWCLRHVLAIAVLTTLACSDAAAPVPASAVELRVPPERLRQNAPGEVYLQYIAHNRSNAPVTVAYCSFTIEHEVAPNVWKSAGASAIVCTGVNLAPGEEVGQFITCGGLAPGRYRITLPWVAQGASSETVAFSNAFNVT